MNVWAMETFSSIHKLLTVALLLPGLSCRQQRGHDSFLPDAQTAGAIIAMFRQENGYWPKDCEFIAKKTATGKFDDPWGRPYSISYTHVNQGYVFSTKGRDGISGTEDDRVANLVIVDDRLLELAR